IEVRMQESKSQQQNRAKAWQLLRARVYDHYQREKDAQRAEARTRMIGSGERSQRIRTYRYKENMIVDHRLEGRSFNLHHVLAGAVVELVGGVFAQGRAQGLGGLWGGEDGAETSGDAWLRLGSVNRRRGIGR